MSLFHPLEFRLQAEIGSPQNTVLLTYPDMIPNGEYTIQVENLNSIYGTELAQQAEAKFSFTNPFFLISAKDYIKPNSCASFQQVSKYGNNLPIGFYD